MHCAQINKFYLYLYQEPDVGFVLKNDIGLAYLVGVLPKPVWILRSQAVSFERVAHVDLHPVLILPSGQ